ncbi:SusC/RagA family TonB-linked outer membrane protein [Desertivirga xinjiangensis]|uniref:SusC/RagA family TonB-linked outer membrane protein n=1 Tax=Desertivirga xinjiangensis TaxID=539206 RepID=UPI00210B157B|nr:TonB-dependent receptor [Pedobacter xinjiangensis]
MKSLYKIVFTFFLAFAAISVYAQNRVISGVVSDEFGAVPGIAVLEKGVSNNGTGTDANGRFRIALKGKGNILVFRGMGYEIREINVGGITTLNVRLQTESKGLNEVVVIGYGTQKKVSVTGSVSMVNREEIQQTPSASLQNALTGKLPGFFSQQRGGRPGADGAEFFVRGVSTFAGRKQSPLILVDDIESTYEDFQNIDANEVQSISVLKDAATTAVYGVKGANGVILVTTRRGKTGSPQINFRSEFGLQMPTNVPEVLNSVDMAMLRNEALKNDGILGIGNGTPEFTEEDIELFRNGSDPYGHPNVDWYNTLFRKSAPISKSNLDLSGGSERLNYFVSLGYQTQDGLLRNFKADDVNNNYSFNRYNFRTNLDVKATSSLSLRLDLSGNNTVTNQPQIGDGAFRQVMDYEELPPYSYPVYNPDGSFGSSATAANNIVGRIKHGGYDRDRQNLLNLNVSATQKLDFLASGLQARVAASISNQTSSRRSLSSSNFPSFSYDPETEKYTPRDVNVFRVDPYSLQYQSGRPRRQSTLQASLNYDRTFANTHNLSVLALYNQNTKLLASFEDDEETESSYIPENFRGFTGRVRYNYKNRYLIEFNGSYNGSDKFAAEKRFGFFPAASAGWVISEEGFFKDNISFVNLLKIRGSLGVVGDDDLGDYKNAYEENYERSGSYSFGESNTNNPTIVPLSLANKEVTWSKERKANAGIDFGFFNNHLSGSAELFFNERYDILAPRQTVPSYFGIPGGQLPPLNLGKVGNRGFEMELNYSTKLSKDFSVSLNANYSFAKNKILEIDEVNPAYPWKIQTGQPVGSFMGYIWDGFYSVEEAADPSVPKYIGSTTPEGGEGTTLPGFLKYRDLNGDGVISDDDRGYFGEPNLPNTTIGFGTGFTYKSLSLNVMLQSSLNYSVQVGYAISVPFKGNLQSIHMKRWTPETAATAEFPSLVSNFHGTYMTTGSNSDFWAVSGDFLRIKSVELAWRLPAKWANKVGMRSASIFANGYNLYTWSRSFERFGVDPEVVRGDPSNSTYPSIYPNSAIFNLGLNLSIK